MIAVLLISAALAAAPSKLAVTPLSGQNLDEQTLDDLSRKLATAFEREGFTVTSPQTTAAALGEDAHEFRDDKAPELARALAVELVVVGNIAKSGKEHLVDLRVLNGADAAVLATHSRKVRSLAGVQAELKRAARALTAVIRPSDQPTTVIEPDDSTPSRARSYAWLPAAGGIVLIGAGTYFLLQTQDSADALELRRMSDRQAFATANNGRQSESLTWASFMLAGGALAAAGAMYFLAPSEDEEAVSVSVLASPQGGAASVSWVLP